LVEEVSAYLSGFTIIFSPSIYYIFSFCLFISLFACYARIVFFLLKKDLSLIDMTSVQLGQRYNLPPASE